MNKDRMEPDFEYFLHEYYAEKVDPTCLDDDLPDCTVDWISDLDCEEFINLGNLYAKKYQSELPRLDEEAVAEIVWDTIQVSIQKDGSLRNRDELEDILSGFGLGDKVAKAICSKFSPKVVRLPKEIDELELPKGWTIGEKQKYNQCLKDIKQSLEEQGIKTDN